MRGRVVLPRLCRFIGLAYHRMRKGEAAEIELRDLDFKAGEIVMRGDAETGTKNWTVRRVPLIPDARRLV